jgi:hypothetical protein
MFVERSPASLKVMNSYGPATPLVITRRPRHGLFAKFWQLSLLGLAQECTTG